MKPYEVKVIDRNWQRHNYVAIAHSWFEAWCTAADEFGVVRITVIPKFKPA